MRPTPGQAAARKALTASQSKAKLDALLKAKMKRTFSNAFSPGHFLKRAYDAVPVPESRAQSHYHHQLERYQDGYRKTAPKKPGFR